ncbi:TetR family transcriptional regulator [Dictyobacter kobayashii]|uniref:TetR family transcriptional regulator n=2 Tax=Dictyobacter kobayashii TaxID=2014872 RepID=A0A402AV50_9CHLR|nr:TetR family transcriptional regulator [Dictyobacter kobayashii]
MGIKERRERERQITRQAILDAALQIARQDSWSAVTIRKVGEQIEYSGPMVYEYFANKEAMLLALLQTGFERLLEAMQQARIRSDEFEVQMFDMANAYWDFAVHNRELYQLMHGLGGVPLDREATLLAVHDVCDLTQKVLIEWSQEVEISLPDPLGATEIIWSLLHGLVSLMLVDRIHDGEQRARNLMQQAIRDQLAAWKNKEKS